MKTHPPNKFGTRTKVLISIVASLALVTLGLVVHVTYYTRVIVMLTMFVAVAFPLVYRTLPWKDSLLGRALMTHAQAVALLYIFSITNFFFEYPGKDHVRALVATYLAIGITFQFVVLLRIKSRAQRDEREKLMLL